MDAAWDRGSSSETVCSRGRRAQGGRFRELVESRRSTRAFHQRPIEREKLLEVLECVRAAPSAGNLQSYAVSVVQRPAMRRWLARAAAQDFVGEAPAVLVFHGDRERSASTYGTRGRDLYSDPGRRPLEDLVAWDPA